MSTNSTIIIRDSNNNTNNNTYSKKLVTTNSISLATDIAAGIKKLVKQVAN